MKRIALIGNMSTNRVDGIRDYTFRLAEAIERETMCHADLILRDASGTWTRVQLDPDGLNNQAPRPLTEWVKGYDAAVIQYQPYMYGAWGLAPWLIYTLWRVRQRRPQLTIGLMIHEKYVRMRGFGQTLQGIWQRVQLAGLRPNVDVIFVSTEGWAASLTRWQPYRPTYYLPVGSNLPDMKHQRSNERRRMGVGDDVVVLVSFGANPANHRIDYIVESANALIRTGRQVTLLNLGAHVSTPRGLDNRVDSRQPGPLSPVLLASQLSAGDVFLAPLIEGISSRRTTLMAALQHGLAVVGTVGPMTDQSLQHARQALRLVPTSDRDSFVSSVRELACDPELRVKLGLSARILYQQKYDWPILVNGLLSSLN